MGHSKPVVNHPETTQTTPDGFLVVYLGVGAKHPPKPPGILNPYRGWFFRVVSGGQP